MTTPLVGLTSPRRTVPYISNDMFKTHARRGVSVDKLVPGGSAEDQDAALADYILQGSDWIDLQTNQQFAAGFDTVTSRVSVGRNGNIVLYPRFRPVIGLTALSVGDPTGPLIEMTDLSAGICTESSITISAYPNTRLFTSQGPLQFGGGVSPLSSTYVRYTYAYGYPVTYLSADVAAGAVSMSLANVAGIVAGQTPLMVRALAQRFAFVATTVTPATGTPAMGSTGAGTVGCPASPVAIESLASSSYPVMVTALPDSLILATVLATRAIIKGTGAGSVAAAAASAPGTPAGKKGPANAGDDYANAWAILDRFTSVWRQ